MRFAALVLCAGIVFGSNWDVLQCVAWGRMFLTYSRTMPVSVALRLTFTPDNLCSLCELADAGRQAARKSDPASAAPLDAKKIQLALTLTESADIAAPLLVSWPVEDFWPDACARSAPPVEPPRRA